MIKLRQLLVMFAALCVLTLAGCSKDDDASPADKESLLTSGAWKYYSTVEDGEEEIYEGDDTEILRFRNDGTFTVTYTDGGDEMTEEGTWELVNDDKYILIDDEATLKITKLDSKNFYMYNEDLDYEIRFKK